ALARSLLLCRIPGQWGPFARCFGMRAAQKGAERNPCLAISIPSKNVTSKASSPARDGCAAISDRRRDSRMILPRAPLPSLIPESAPFCAAQRVWLHGLFAGLPSLDRGVTSLSSAQPARLPGALELAAPATPASEDDGAPWHDPARPLADRMKLAEGRALRRRMMAAMGQQDCGQCGYNCQDYSDALFLKKEERLNLCVPGGKETTRTLKALHQELGPAPAAAQTRAKPLRLPVLRLHRPPRRDVRASARPRRAFCHARASTRRAPRRRPGILSST